jgi:hypothetical protein
MDDRDARNLEEFESRVRDLLAKDIDDANADFRPPTFGRPTAASRLRLAATAAITGVVAILAIGALATRQPGPASSPSLSASNAPLYPSPGSAAPTPTRTAPAPSITTVMRPDWPGRVVATFASTADALAFDAARRVVWVVVPQSRSPELLYRYDPGSGRTESWELPATTYLGEFGEVLVDDVGAVWVDNDGYRIVRFDPRTGQSSSYVFPLKVPGVDWANGGTWVSAIASDGDGILVARNQVPDLVRLSPELKITKKVDIPREFAGATGLAALGNHLFITEGRSGPDGNVVRLSRDGVVEIRFSATAERLRPTTEGILATHDITERPLDNEVLSVDGRVVRTIPPPFTLPAIRIVVTNPLGQPVDATYQPTPRALVSNGLGTSWYVVDGEPQALLREYVAN